MSNLSEHVLRNREAWTGFAPDYVAAAKRNWAADSPTWGIWGIPESEAQMLGDETRLVGMDAIELGCGTAYVSAWLARRGARPVGIDVTPAQLDTAKAMQKEHGVTFPLIEGSAEALPFPDASFDLAISEYGASIWCDPYVWIPEAARVLRPGGELRFLVNGLLVMLCTPETALENEPATTQLSRDLFGLHRCEWPDDNSVEFHLPHGKMIDLLARCGMQVERLIELQAPVNASSTYGFVTPDWAKRWPCEEVWIARKVRTHKLR